MNPKLVTAHPDPALHATVLRTVPLLYEEGADPEHDRPAHVRAGSGLAWVGRRLAVIQDDAAFLALVDPESGAARAVHLPAEEGVRQFDEGRGNKHLKADLEACVAVPGEDGRLTLLAFGSGSSDRRERVLVVRGLEDADGEPEVDVVDASAFYAELRAEAHFAGSEMNIEGAALLGGTLRLFGRGNGAARGEVLPLDATCDVPLGDLLAFLADPGSTTVPEPDGVVQYDLGTIDGCRLGFTDASPVGGDRVLFTAAAEDSPDAIQDGPVAGCAIGILEADGSARWALLRDADGAPFTGKVEGLAPWPGRPDRLWIVIDRDDPTLPAELCEVELSGPWPGG